jgi:hypothetical protein
MEQHMPDPKNNHKATGDTHLPEIEEEDLERQSRPNAGEIKDKDAETSDSYGHTRDSGERPKP